MGQLLLLLVGLVVLGAVILGVAVLITGTDPGLETAEPDGRAIPLPTHRPLVESDVQRLRFDTAVRGYRMSQVDQALRRMAYDIGYKDELIGVLEAEVVALRSGRIDDAEALRRAREAAQAGTGEPAGSRTPGTDPTRAPAAAETMTPIPAEPDVEDHPGPAAGAATRADVAPGDADVAPRDADSTPADVADADGAAEPVVGTEALDMRPGRR
ncbi:MAG: DivIVA domain-containing protein [Micromonosporaceae bacterium]